VCQEWLHVSSWENRSLFLTPPFPPSLLPLPRDGGDAAAGTRRPPRRTLVPRTDAQTARATHRHKPCSPRVARPCESGINLNSPVAWRASVRSHGGDAAPAPEFRAGVRWVREMEEGRGDWLSRWRCSQRLSSRLCGYSGRRWFWKMEDASGMSGVG